MEEPPAKKAKKIRVWSELTLANREKRKAETARKKRTKMRRSRKARDLHKAQEFDEEGKVKRFHSKKKYVTGKAGWVQKEVKRLQALAKAREEGVQVPKTTSRKQMMQYLDSGGALSADFQRVPKPGKKKSGTSHEDRSGFLHETIRTGGAMAHAGGIRKAKARKVAAALAPIKTVKIPIPRKARRKRQKKNTADFFTDLKKEANPFEGVSFEKMPNTCVMGLAFRE